MPDMDNKLPAPIFIDAPIQSAKHLEEWLKSLGPQGRIALDFEASGFHRYRDFVCLAQLNVAQNCVAVDALAEEGVLNPLKSLIEDPGLKKVFHGCDYDVRLMKKNLGFYPQNLFDTMVASQLLGKEAVGLGSLLEVYFNVKTNKKYQKADWTARPLGPELIEYALLDVAYLFELHDMLSDELAQKGRSAWAEEEFALLCAVEQAPQVPQTCFDIKGSNTLKPPELAVLEELVRFREAVASEWDRPAFKILSTDVLLHLAQKPPKSRRELMDTPGAGKSILSRLGDGILDALAKGQSAKEFPRRPVNENRLPPMNSAEKKRLEKLKTRRAEIAKELGIDPGIMTSGSILEKIARAPDAEVPEKLKTSLKKWQYGVMGEELIKALE